MRSGKNILGCFSRPISASSSLYSSVFVSAVKKILDSCPIFKLRALPVSGSHEKGGGKISFQRSTCSSLTEQPKDPEQLLVTQVNTSYAGRLSNYLQKWALYTNDRIVLSWISGYKIPFSKKPVKRYLPKQSFTSNELSKVEEAIAQLLQIGAVSKTNQKSGQFLSSVFLVPKPDGSSRFILNLKALNRFLHPSHFKLEDHRTVFKLLSPNCFFTSLDIKDAYFLISVNNEFRKYL